MHNMVIRHPELSEHEGIHQLVRSVVNEIYGVFGQPRLSRLRTKTGLTRGLRLQEQKSSASFSRRTNG